MQQHKTNEKNKLGEEKEKSTKNHVFRKKLLKFNEDIWNSEDEN